MQSCSTIATAQHSTAYNCAYLSCPEKIKYEKLSLN